MTRLLRGLAWLVLTTATISLLLVTAHATTFTAQLVNPISGASPQFIRLQLRGCGSNIPTVSGVGVVGADSDGYITLWPDTSGAISVTVQDDANISCAGTTGNAYYHVELWSGSQTQSTLLRHKLSENDYHITGTSFDLGNPGTPLSPTPTVPSVVDATALKGKTMVGTLTDGQSWCLNVGTGYMEPCTPSGGGGTGNATSIQGKSVTGTTPSTDQSLIYLAGGSWGLGTFLKIGGGTLTGALTLSGAPTSDLHASTKKYVDDQKASIFSAGGAFAAAVTVLAPSADMNPATKKYVDDSLATGNFVGNATQWQGKPLDATTFQSPSDNWVPYYNAASGKYKVGPAPGGAWGNIQGTITDQSDLNNTFAKLSSPAFVDTPTAPTAASDTNSTQLATTAFVQAQKVDTALTGDSTAEHLTAGSGGIDIGASQPIAMAFLAAADAAPTSTACGTTSTSAVLWKPNTDTPKLLEEYDCGADGFYHLRASASLPDAEAGVKGVLQLAGDFDATATAALPKVASLMGKIPAASNGIATLDNTTHLTAAQIPVNQKIHKCEYTWTGSGTGGKLQSADDETVKCKVPHDVSGSWTVTHVYCHVNSSDGTTFNPIITGGAALLSGALTCTTAMPAGTLSGSPTLSADGTLDLNITQGGTPAATEITVVIEFSE